MIDQWTRALHQGIYMAAAKWQQANNGQKVKGQKQTAQKVQK